VTLLSDERIAIASRENDKLSTFNFSAIYEENKRMSMATA